MRKGKSMITVCRKQYPLVIAHCITIHKSQGSTYEYMIGNLDRTSRSSNPKRKVNLQPGQAYTLVSRSKSKLGTQLKNFEPEMIIVNDEALNEMKRLQEKSLLKWSHPIENESGCVLALFNLRSWNLHLKHFLCDPMHLLNCSLFCFTETNLQTGIAITINEFDFGDNWIDFHKQTQHGLALCYNSSSVTMVEELKTIDKIEILALMMQHLEKDFIVVVIYRQPGSLGSFFQT